MNKYLIQKSNSKKYILLYLLLCTIFILHAQTPQWHWARSAGGTGVNQAISKINLDSAGNVYEVLQSNASSITLGASTFHSPSPGHTYIYMLTKYDISGSVVWAKQLPSSISNNIGMFNALLNNVDFMSTTPQGYTYFIFSMGLSDTFRLGGQTAIDTTFHLDYNNNRGYAIAKYDPNGNVISLKYKNFKHTNLAQLLPFDEGHFAVLGDNNYRDTLDGQIMPVGSFIGLIDTSGRLTKVKYLGYDTSSGQPFPLFTGQLCISKNKAIYLSIDFQATNHFDPIALPIGSTLALASGWPMFIKFDSNMIYQWYKGAEKHCNMAYQMASDPFDNLYLQGSVGGIQGSDTITLGSLNVLSIAANIFVQSPAYYCLIKINANGQEQWIDTFPAGSIARTIICTDRMAYIYMGGQYPDAIGAGPYSHADAGGIFCIKVKPNSQVMWLQTTQNGMFDISSNAIGEDGHGNIYMNGGYVAPTSGLSTFSNGSPIFGTDTLICRQPTAGYSSAANCFTARLGFCSPPTPVISATDALHWCGGDSVRLNAPLAHSYLWSSGDTISSVVVKTSGLYSVYISDTLGCYARSGIDTVSAYTIPLLHTDSLPTIGMGNGIAIVTASGGTPSYTYLWSNTQTTDTIRHLNAGWYRVTVTDHNGCQKSDSVYIRLLLGIEGMTEAHITLYPNPSNGTFYIYTPIEAQIIIYDYAGQQLLKQNIIAGQNKIANEGLPAGIYAVEIKTNSGSYSSKINIDK